MTKVEIFFHLRAIFYNQYFGMNFLPFEKSFFQTVIFFYFCV